MGEPVILTFREDVRGLGGGCFLDTVLEGLRISGLGFPDDDSVRCFGMVNSELLLPLLLPLDTWVGSRRLGPFARFLLGWVSFPPAEWANSPVSIVLALRIGGFGGGGPIFSALSRSVANDPVDFAPLDPW